ncbi:hypothetical protein NDU88_001335 [Pleurodeles waltl]|uniref:Uncharacterized protein n=1 Tax=Pleurodeles waltl TaxID=8319 RepID=A0AAV7LYB2_PLEWA|nr:hypothetical protein NDU88_001335 [Pleurodeles waltl]
MAWRRPPSENPAVHCRVSKEGWLHSTRSETPSGADCTGTRRLASALGFKCAAGPEVLPSGLTEQVDTPQWAGLLARTAGVRLPRGGAAGRTQRVWLSARAGSRRVADAGTVGYHPTDDGSVTSMTGNGYTDGPRNVHAPQSRAAYGRRRTPLVHQ